MKSIALNTQDAEQALLSIYGLQGSAQRLPGEYDDNFHIKTSSGEELILKISRADEDPDIIELQNLTLNKLVADSLPFATPKIRLTLDQQEIGELTHHHHRLTRLFTFIPGKLFAQLKTKNEKLLIDVGTQLGYLTKSLQDIKHHAGKRKLKWDLKQAYWICDALNVISNENDKSIIEFYLVRFTENILPQMESLPHSLIHGDVNDYNIVASESAVTGFIDFGDLVETATICELAIAMTYAIFEQENPLEAATNIIRGYHRIFPLSAREIALLYDLIAMRLCTSVINSAIRKAGNPQDEYLVISEKPAWNLLRKWKKISPEHASDTLLQATQQHSQQLIASRKQYIGPNLSLSYQTPLHIVRGSGQYLYDVTGREFLDCVNNISHVGHCHPRVVAAGQQQMSQLNTNTRYLHENLTRFAERLIATLPAPLEVCYFVCSGSEANELALRLAETYTGRSRFAVLDHGYHGNTARLINISPYKFNCKGGKGKTALVDVIPVPDPLRATHQQPITINPDIAAFISEAYPGCAGQLVLPSGFLATLYQSTKQAGGVCIADEVQTGLGRIGSHYYGFQAHDVIPDIVTLGKPLGNGHPVAAVITRREIADAFNNGMEYFNSFGGNPVSCAIGLSVLDVIADEKLQQHALDTGDYLKTKLNNLKDKFNIMGDVRGSGLFLGIEFITDTNTMNPNPALANCIVNNMKGRGILLSVDGPHHNVIKIKPPMVFTLENADFLVTELNDALK